VRFLGLFVKLALQTNKKLCLKNLQWVLLEHSLQPLQIYFFVNLKSQFNKKG
jgi:hypothetical protein